MSLPADIQAILDRLEPQFRQAFAEAIARVQSATQLRAVIDHLTAGNIESAVLALRLDQTFFAPLDRMVEESFWQGGVAALAGLPRIPDPFPVAGSSSALMDATPARKDGFEIDQGR